MPAHISWVNSGVLYRIFQVLKRDFRQALGFTWKWFMRPRPLLLIGIAALVAVGVVWVLPWDDKAPLVLRPTDQEARESVKQVAQALSFTVILLGSTWFCSSACCPQAGCCARASSCGLPWPVSCALASRVCART